MLRYFKEEGFFIALSRIFCSVFRMLLKYEKMYLYELDISQSVFLLKCPLPIRFTVASVKEIYALDNFMYQDENDIRRRFIHGDTCFLGYLSNKIVYISWIDYQRILIPEIDKEIPINSTNAYIYNVRTDHEYRRRGISSYAYTKIAEYLKEHKVTKLFVAVSNNNGASVKSIEKAGFIRIRKITYIKILCLFKRYYEKDLLSEAKLYVQG